MPADIDRTTHQVACEVVCDLRAAIEHLSTFPRFQNDWDLQALARRRQQMFAALTPDISQFSPHHVLAIMRQLMPKDSLLSPAMSVRIRISLDNCGSRTHRGILL